MDDQNKHKANNFEKFLNYFKDLLSKGEKHAFEKEMMLDPFEEEAFDGLSGLNSKELEEDLHELQSRITERTRKKKLMSLPAFKYAAAAIFIIGVGTTILLIRQSINRAPVFKDFVQAEDSSLFRVKPLYESKDSLKNGFAFTHKSSKQEKKEIQKHAIPTEEIEIASSGKETISGKDVIVVRGSVISSSDNEPVPGVYVLVKGTSIGTVTDLQGNFSVEVSPEEETILSFSTIGFASQELELYDDNYLNIKLNEELIAMEEVVVVGYGVQKKSDQTGTMSSVSEGDLSETQKNEALTSDQALEGRAAGVQVEPGRRSRAKVEKDESAEIRIRGMESDEHSNSESEGIDLHSIACEEVSIEGNTIVKGIIVSSSDGEPLPGVNVIVKGTAIGTVSDLKGEFALEVPDDKQVVLEFNYIGFISEEVALTNYNTINLAMTEDLLALDEVVVIGYGVQNESTVSAPVVIKPKPANGLRGFKDYIQENIRYSLLPDFEKNVVVKLAFTVANTGEIQNIRILKSAGTAFDEEATRLLMEGPEWHTGTIDGVPVDEEVTLKIKFTP